MRTVGFGVKEGMPDYDTMKDKIDKAVKKHFKPEFESKKHIILGIDDLPER